ncbi:hypothetical protein [Tenacibaculum amylolyticum]|uniref:hypothetical protein n=1 Tax=Tenacibaculum amylolyticum TaxID=104269 RepID=UPI0038954DAF
MKKYMTFFLLFTVLFSCQEKKSEHWKEKINKLKEEIVKKDSLIKAYEYKEIDIPEVESIDEANNKTKKQLQTLGVVDKQVLIDTIELKPLVVFEREVKLTKLEEGLSVEDLGSISEFREEIGYKVFSICNGDSLPLEVCNCTHNIYVAIEPEELGEPFELLKIGPFYNVKLDSLERKEEGDILLTFEHGELPRKVLQVNLSTMKFL